MIVGIIGRGRMGSALARALAAHGGPVLIAGRGDPVRPPDPFAPYPGIRSVPTGAVVAGADLVVLMLPFAAAVELALAGRLDDGRGRTVIDATNPPQAGVAPPAPAGSGGRLLAELLPQWRVVKALNTVPAGMLDEPVLDGRPVTVPLAGDHPPAKAQVSALLRRLGFAPVDVGGIDRAPALESLADLLMAISSRHALRGRLGFQVALAEPPAAVDGGLSGPAHVELSHRAPAAGGERQRRPAPAAESARSPAGRPPRPSR
ncbi:NADPH-dependent F420 reductase [Micromonospora sp. NPDC048063]|uniref:NADPH-dependent F420 reductase n=1 Tax=Micromonospora sp. NPDC048063 TaxID=3364256 RepID=UPI00371B3B32